MFRPIAAIFRLLQFCSKSVINMPLLRGDVSKTQIPHEDLALGSRAFWSFLPPSKIFRWNTSGLLTMSGTIRTNFM